MGKLFVVLAIICLSSVCACTNKRGENAFAVENAQILSPSEKLVRFFLKYKFYDANEIKEQMLIEKRNDELKKLMDSVGIFNNIEAYIYDIKVRNVNEKIKNLSYTLSIFDTQSETEAWEDSIYTGFIELKCAHTMQEGDNYLIEKIANIPNFSTVYIDGIFAVDNKTNKPKMLEETSQLIHPTYSFHTTDISANELDSISKSLQDAILAGHKVFDYTFMGKGDFDKKINDNLVEKFNAAKTGLNPKDSLYLIRYMKGIMLDSSF